MHDTPLSDDEYDQLDDLLAALDQPNPTQISGVSALEGLLTAVVIAPRPVARDAWLPATWSEKLASLALRHHEYMRKWMRQDPGSFEPIYECGSAWSAQAWCQGFVAGIELAADDWAPLQSAHPEWFAPFLRQGDDWQRAVTPAVIRINAHYHAEPAKPAKTVKLGRNDPCSCGSGKKFKKCCDA